MTYILEELTIRTVMAYHSLLCLLLYLLDRPVCRYAVELAAGAGLVLTAFGLVVRSR